MGTDDFASRGEGMSPWEGDGPSRRRHGALRALILVLAVPGGLAAIDPGDLVCPPGGTPLRWETFGLAFFENHCGACHDWTNYTTVYGLRYVLLDLVMTGRMPAAGGLPQEDRDLLAEFVACDLPREDPRCPPRGTALAWGNFASPFFAARCGACHSLDLSGPDRNGAPADQNWDDYDAVVKYAPRILDQVMKAKMPPGGWILANEAEGLREWIACGLGKVPAGAEYQRGDPDDDGVTDISDAVALLDFLFESGALGCLDAADSDASGELDITDAVYLLEYLYLAGPPPPPPFYGLCGGSLDLGCVAFSSCPSP